VTTAPDLSRYADILTWIDDLAERDADLVCCWIGGSAVTGGYDEHSDLDINVLAAPKTFARVFDDLVASLTSRFAVTSLWRLPDETYADGRQLFATFDGSPGALDRPTRLLDVVVYEATDEHRHIDVRRHGTPLVRFDPDGLIVLRDDDEAGLRRGAEHTVDQIRQRRLVAEWWSTAPSPATTCPRPSRSTFASRSSPWCSCSGPGTARSATTTCSATSTRT
jgi:hypothetical protein